MRRAFELLALLGDGAEHSGAELSQALGVTRAAVWNQVQRLREAGIEIRGVAGQGYALAQGFEALDRAALRERLDGAACVAWPAIEVARVTDSTNERLLRALDSGDIHGHALFAEFQTAGRGRRGDRWISPPGSGLCFSCGWRFDAPPSTFSALSLVVGLAVVRCLREAGADDARLKWPNDVVRNGRKLAGILIEMRSEAGGPCHTVIGIGVNIALSPQARAAIDQPSDDVTAACGHAVSRNALAASLLGRLGAMLAEFATQGFAPFRDDWLAHDALVGRTVLLDLGPRTVSGRARGVDAHGALLIEHGGRCEPFVSGHLRAV
ncbi:MAG: biotin--[acetyl-CoA-carboxylase] ligase [Gammaproteobacteria bacterium]|nr:biotin--[acetyl-CoA-carboxylase] ligase [Gammaproteobacteria bacterium]